MKKILFVDDSQLTTSKGIKRIMGKPEKCSENPIIKADQPWERDAAFVDSGLVIYDADCSLFKAWYQGGACYGPDDQSHMCYAESKDGIHWHKPNLGIVEYQKSKENNIVLMAQCMMHDPAPIIDIHDSDPNRRFKAIWWGGRKDNHAKNDWTLGHCVGFSPDGIHWTESPDNPVWPADAEVAVPFNCVKNEEEFLMFSSADSYGMRVVAQTESDDFIHWNTPPKLVFASDDQDPPGTEMAGLSAIDYYGYRIGMLWVIHNLGAITQQEWNDIVAQNKKQGFFGYPIEMNNTRCRQMHTEIVLGNSTGQWHRPHRQPFIPMGEQGQWDEVILLAGRPIVANDRIYIYYTGHGRTKQTPGVAQPQKLGQWNVDTGLATLRLDGFAYLEPAEEQGELITGALNYIPRQLFVNTKANRGSVKLEWLDKNNQPIPGFTYKEAQPISGDHLQAEPVWNGKTQLPEMDLRNTKIRVLLQNAKLFSLVIIE